MSKKILKSEERRTFIQAIGTFGTLLASGGVVSATPSREPTGQRDEVLVGVADDTEMATVETRAVSAVPQRASVTHRNQTLEYFAVELPEEVSDRARKRVKEAIENRPGVEYAEVNGTYETQLAPNDPRFDTQYAPQQVAAPSAWDETLGSENVTVAVVDSGVQYDHPDLSTRFGSDEGRDFADGDGDPRPDTTSESHGTHVVGCASASTNNGEGVTGVSNSRLLSARALDESGSGTVSDIADAIQWATDQGADVINLSLGGDYSSTLQNAVTYAAERGVCVVAAAGNSGDSVLYPAASDQCVAVSALDPDEDLASFSNSGPAVDVAAPGVNVLSTYPIDDYREMSGTSVSSPVAAGVAALGLAADPDLSGADLRRRLRDTAVDVGLPSEYQGAGRVDAANIVDAASDNTGGGDDGSDGGDESDGDDGSDGGSDTCNQTVSGSADGVLWYYGSDSYSWSVYFSNPCEITVDLDAGSDDFDLYATRDGRPPSTSDYDEASTGSGGSESITLSDPSSGGSIGILVDAGRDWGSYTLSVTETGGGTASAQDADGADPLTESDSGSHPGRGRDVRGVSDRGR